MRNFYIKDYSCQVPFLNEIYMAIGTVSEREWVSPSLAQEQQFSCMCSSLLTEVQVYYDHDFSRQINHCLCARVSPSLKFHFGKTQGNLLLY